VWDALLLDFDGVLVNTEPVHYACWREILAPFGIDLEWSYYESECIGISDRLMVERLGAQRVPPVGIEEIWPQYDRKKALFRQRLEENPPFLPATSEIIRDLAADYRLAVVSSSGRTEVEPPIERAGLLPCFQAIVCGRDAQRLKPAPDPYLRAAELLGARHPLVIEDSDAGVESARAAGFDVIRVSNAESMPREVRAKLLAQV
jgi:HAD superfamily hydrolase (TIGR01509 family)